MEYWTLLINILTEQIKKLTKELIISYDAANDMRVKPLAKYIALRSKQYNYTCGLNQLVEYELELIFFLLQQVEIENSNGNIYCTLSCCTSLLCVISLTCWKLPAFELDAYYQDKGSTYFRTAGIESLYYLIYLLIKKKDILKRKLALDLNTPVSFPSFRFDFEITWRCLLQCLESLYKDFDYQNKSQKQILHNNTVLPLEYLCKQKLINAYGIKYLKYNTAIPDETKLINHMFLSMNGFVNKRNILIDLSRPHKHMFWLET